jgi:trehalose 6-phosphate synthase/phosphatase
MVMVIGDDVTDEDMFKAIPPEGYSIKVGYHPTNARYSLRSVKEVRSFLRELMGR